MDAVVVVTPLRGPALCKLVECFDIHCLGIASLTCQAWQACARDRVQHVLRSEAVWQEFSHREPSRNADCLAALAGRLIGVGGMSRVYQYAGIPELCLKVCVGGSFVRTCGCTDPFTHYLSHRCREVDATCKSQDGSILEAMYGWCSATTDLCGRISPEACNTLLRKEYRILKRAAWKPASNCLLPLPLASGVDTRRGCNYYLMERLPGLTLKQLLQCSVPIVSGLAATPVADGHDSTCRPSEVGSLDLLPAIISLLRTLEEMRDSTNRKFWHGDIKPANMMLWARRGEAGAVHARLIDPVARPGDESGPGDRHLKQFLTVQYNPKAYMQVFADTFGLALCMLEVLCDEQPFQGFIRGTGDDDVNEKLKYRLLQFKATWAEHPLVKWLVDWIDMDITTFLNHRQMDSTRGYMAMLTKLEAFQASGFTLARKWKGPGGNCPWELLSGFS